MFYKFYSNIKNTPPMALGRAFCAVCYTPQPHLLRIRLQRYKEILIFAKKSEILDKNNRAGLVG